MTFAWTTENVEKLKAGVLDGKSASIIGAELGITRSAVLGKCWRLKMRVMRKPVEKKDATIRRRTKVRLNPHRVRVMKFPEVIEVFIPAAATIIPLNKSLMELGHNDCRYPYGDEPRQMTFCGHITIFGSSYCAGHHISTHRPFVKKREGANAY